jgi:hypothetical protein
MVSAQDNDLANLHLREELRLNAAMRKLRRFTPYGDLEGLASQWEFMGSTGAPSVDLVAEALARETEEVSPTAEQTKAPPSGTPSSQAPARKSTEARDVNWESVASTNVAPRKQSKESNSAGAATKRASLKRLDTRGAQRPSTADAPSPQKEPNGSNLRGGTKKFGGTKKSVESPENSRNGRQFRKEDMTMVPRGKDGGKPFYIASWSKHRFQNTEYPNDFDADAALTGDSVWRTPAKFDSWLALDFGDSVLLDGITFGCPGDDRENPKQGEIQRASTLDSKMNNKTRWIPVEQFEVPSNATSHSIKLGGTKSIRARFWRIHLYDCTPATFKVLTWLRADETMKGAGGSPRPSGFPTPARQTYDGDTGDFSEVTVMVVDKLNRDREPGSRPGSANIQTRKTAVIASALRQKLRHRMRMQAFQNDSWADDWGSSKVHMFPELTLGNDEMFKKLSKKFGLDVNMVEHIHNIFRRFDEDGSGEIEYDEFTQMMCDMLGAEHGEVPEKRLRQFWHEIDIDQSHCIEFEEFMLFYVQNFLDPDDPNGSPMRNFYRRAAQREPGEDGEKHVLDDLGPPLKKSQTLRGSQMSMR